MTTDVKHCVVLVLCAAAIAVLAIFAIPVPARADNGCIAGYVPRNARPGDDVCVTPAVAARTAQENATAADRREPNGGVYGPLTCKQGYVWREAFDGDGVCVTPDIRAQTWADNAAAPSRKAFTPIPTPPAATPPAQPPVDIIG
jgi:hypothetical protein